MTSRARAGGFIPMRLVSADTPEAYERAIEAEHRRAVALTVERNRGLVHTAVQRYRVALAKASGLEEADLIQAGLMGLAIAAERFDPTRGVAFSTYSMHWIRHHIRRELSNRARTVRIPVWALEKGHAGIPTVSLNAPACAADGRTIEDFMAAPERDDDDEPDEAEQRRRLEPHLAALEPRLALVVRLRLAGRTLKEIGDSMTPTVSRERVRQLEVLAIGQLRRALAKRRGRRAA
jgi:RNA polymerase sigma factor (sigma-70 family)